MAKDEERGGPAPAEEEAEDGAGDASKRSEEDDAVAEDDDGPAHTVLPSSGSIIAWPDGPADVVGGYGEPAPVDGEESGL